MKQSIHQLMNLTYVFILALNAISATLNAEDSPVIAIDILLEPDAKMLKESDANNARLLKVYPKGFSLDSTHTPTPLASRWESRSTCRERIIDPTFQDNSTSPNRPVHSLGATQPVHQNSCSKPTSRHTYKSRYLAKVYILNE
jgi:hypothetical protein